MKASKDHPERPPRRPSLRQILFYGSTLTSALSVALFTAILVYVTHRQVHRQTDALLLQLATYDVDDLKGEFERGVHVHDSVVMISPTSNIVTKRYSVIFNERCEILAASSDITASHVPSEWCEETLIPGSYRHFDADGLTPFTLRAAAFVAQSPNGEPLVFFVGVGDAVIDASTWEILFSALPLALFVILSIGVGSGFLGWRLSADLTRVSRACHTIERGQLLSESGRSAELFAISPKAPKEVQTLTQTIQDLIRRVEALLETQNRFLREAAHELRTPLTSLQGELELALRRERSKEEYRQALEYALRDARRLIELSESLLDAARARSSALTLESLSLRALLDESLERRRRQLEEKQVAVHIEEEGEGDFLVQAHQLSLSRVLDNLLQNALVHGPPRNLFLKLRRGGPPSGKNSWVELWVRDDGPGIPEHLASHLFSPFQRSSQAKGYGLGLYLCRLLMHRQGGELSFSPPPKGERGACFCIRLLSAQESMRKI